MMTMTLKQLKERIKTTKIKRLQYKFSRHRTNELGELGGNSPIHSWAILDCINGKYDLMTTLTINCYVTDDFGRLIDYQCYRDEIKRFIKQETLMECFEAFDSQVDDD